VLQSSAAVHRGCSGGALVEARRGLLLGLITTNVKQQDGAIMPHVNFSLPTELLAPLRDFVGTPIGPDGVESLRRSWEAAAANRYEQTLWRLEPEALGLPSAVEERRQRALRRLQELAEEEDKLATPNAADGLEAADLVRAAAPKPVRRSSL